MIFDGNSSEVALKEAFSDFYQYFTIGLSCVQVSFVLLKRVLLIKIHAGKVGKISKDFRVLFHVYL